MSPMPPKDSINDLPGESSSGVHPLSIVTISLDTDTQRLLKLSLSLLPSAGLRTELTDYYAEIPIRYRSGSGIPRQTFVLSISTKTPARPSRFPS